MLHVCPVRRWYQITAQVVRCTGGSQMQRAASKGQASGGVGRIFAISLGVRRFGLRALSFRPLSVGCSTTLVRTRVFTLVV